jgi:endogenous inhibitor of DNA gyrase (YacG/DUF329 family)
MKYECPECGKVVDYVDGRPSDGRTYCTKTNKNVKMIPVKEE